VGKNARILIVEDDQNERQGLADLLSVWGYETETAADGREALEKVSSFNPAVVISDLRMPRLTGMELLRQVHEIRSGLSFIMLTGQGTIEEAVEATKLGAFNFLEKPLDTKRLQVELRNCLERHESGRQLEAAQRRLRDLGFLGNIVGRSKEMQEVTALVTMVAPSRASVLITGESGTGKELVAGALHSLSQRAQANYVRINCAAIP